MAEVTVVIPFLNRKDLLPKAIDSVFGQTYTDWKLVLVDDGSTDDYGPSIQNYLEDHRVQLIRNPKNLGQSKSLNKALSIVNTPYMVQLDSDDWYFPNTLELLVKEAKKLPEKVAVISGNLNVVWEDLEGNVRRTKQKIGRSFSDRYEFLFANTNIVPRFYRTSALKKVGGWPTNDPYNGRYREDMLILYQLIEHYRFHWIDKPLYNQRVHRTNLTHQRKQLHETAEWSVRKALKRWGDDYKPVFCVTHDGWKKVRRLSPTVSFGEKKTLKINSIEANRMERLIKKAISNKSSLCLTSLASIKADEELSLLRKESFWKLMSGKKVVLLSKWAPGFTRKIKPLCKKRNIRIVESFAISEKTSGTELANKLTKLRYDVVLVSTDFNAVNLCKTLLKKQNKHKIIIDVKDGMLQLSREKS